MFMIFFLLLSRLCLRVFFAFISVFFYSSFTITVMSFPISCFHVNIHGYEDEDEEDDKDECNGLLLILFWYFDLLIRSSLVLF